MANKELLNSISGHNKVKLAITDLDGVLLGKIISMAKFKSVLDAGFGFCNVVFGWDMHDRCYSENAGIRYTGWHTGFPDAQVVIASNTQREIPWEQNTPFFIADFRTQEGQALPLCPRNILKKIRATAQSMGFEAMFAQEYEWFNFVANSELATTNTAPPVPITSGMFGYSILRASQRQKFFYDLFDSLAAFKIPLEGLHTETGPGVYEAAISYQDVLEAADRAVLFKTAVKEIAHRHGIMPSFMAKWNDKLPGCSGHLHQSLWRKGKNIFYDSSAPNGMSAEMQSYLAGLLYCLPQLLPLYAPLVNSYKRLVAGMWAPTTLTWGHDNRTTAMRVITGSEHSHRIENRVAGADVNPYLAMAASLASGLYGIKHKLQLTTPATVGNADTELKHGMFANNLRDAVLQMQKSEVAKEIFGSEFVDHFCATRLWEWQQFSHAVTDWELQRYLELA